MEPSITSAASGSPPRAHPHWRWLFVVPQTVFTAVAMQGVPFSISVLHAPVSDARTSWPKHSVSYCLSVAAVLLALTGWAWSRDMRSGNRRGVRFWMGTGIVTYQVGLAVAALSLTSAVPESAWPMFIGGMATSCAASLGVVYASCMTHAVAHLGPGLGASVFGGSVGISATFWAPLLSFLAEHLTLPQTLLVVGLCPVPVLLMLPFVRLSCAPKGAALGFAKDPTLTVLEMIKSKEYYLVLAGIVGGLLPGWGTISMYANALQDLGGISHSHAATLTAVVNAAYCAGRLAGGVAVERAGPVRGFVFLLVTEAAAFALTASLSGHSFSACVFGLCLASACFGAVKVGIPSLCVSTFGVRNFGVAFMMTGAGFATASIWGPFISGQLSGTRSVLGGSGAPHDHDNFFGLSVLVCVLGAFGVLFLRPHPVCAEDMMCLRDDDIPSPLSSPRSDCSVQGSSWVFVTAAASPSGVVHFIRNSDWSQPSASPRGGWGIQGSPSAP